MEAPEAARHRRAVGRCCCTRKDNDPTLDPATAPARKDPRWEKYWNIQYSILGSFKTPEERAKIPYASAIDGGGDPDTEYMLIQLSRKFGPVYVMRGKMPTFPNTYAGAERQGSRGHAGRRRPSTGRWSAARPCRPARSSTA